MQWDDLDLVAAKVHIQRSLTRRGVKGSWQVFASEFGRPLHLSSLYRYNFRRIMQAAGLGTASKDKFTTKYRLYDLRHTAATLLLRAGENPKVVSERLGHASVAFTMDVYAASLPDLQAGAAQKMETLFGESA